MVNGIDSLIALSDFLLFIYRNATVAKILLRIFASITMEYYSAIKKNTFEAVLMRWMKLEPIIQSEVSQRLPDWVSLELSPSVESCGCGLGPSPVRLG